MLLGPDEYLWSSNQPDRSARLHISIQTMIEFIDLPPLQQLEHDWLDLEGRSDGSFFTSWSWIGCWLALLPASIQPKLLRATSGDEIVGMALLVPRRTVRHHLLPVRGLYLHATGDPALDDITIEYNGFLADRRFSSVIAIQFLEHLTRQVPQWDELHLDGVADLDCTASPDLARLRIRRQPRNCPYVDLDEVRAAGGDYLSLLGQSTRYNIRRSLKEYAKLGPVTFTAAKDVGEAVEFFSHLMRLHQEHWLSKGRPGAFAESSIASFHERMIRSRHDSGEVQLLRASAGDRAIGYLYNYVYRGEVHNYQTGFDYATCRKQSPGLVTHALCVEQALSQGHRIYDFMAGDVQYKRALATHSRSLVWIVAQRDLFKYRLEDMLRTCKQRASALKRDRVTDAWPAEAQA